MDEVPVGVGIPVIPEIIWDPFDPEFRIFDWGRESRPLSVDWCFEKYEQTTIIYKPPPLVRSQEEGTGKGRQHEKGGEKKKERERQNEWKDDKEDNGKGGSATHSKKKKKKKKKKGQEAKTDGEGSATRNQDEMNGNEERSTEK